MAQEKASQKFLDQPHDQSVKCSISSLALEQLQSALVGGMSWDNKNSLACVITVHKCGAVNTGLWQFGRGYEGIGF